jgi:putative oxidoreductase
VNAHRYLPFVGRMFIGLPFVVSGLSKLAAYGPTIRLIASSNLPLPSPLAGAISIDNRRAKDRAQIGAAALGS